MQRSWLRHCTTSQKVAGSISDEVIGFFNWPNLSSCIIALGSTQPLTERSTRNFPGGKEWPARKADNFTVCESIVYKMWEPRPLTNLWASTACWRDRFAFLCPLNFFRVSHGFQYDKSEYKTGNSHTGDYEVFSLLGYNDVESVKGQRTFRRTCLFLLQGLNVSLSGNQNEGGSKKRLLWFSRATWRWISEYRTFQMSRIYLFCCFYV
jgi:hypothetical protein